MRQDRLRELVSYDPETGIFRWLVKTNRRIIVGSIVGTNNNGYRKTSMDGREYMLHRLAWLYVHGSWPLVIDHLNGDRADNRIANLRDVSHRTNRENERKAHRQNKSGLLGVSTLRGQWLAKIIVDGVNVRIGLFDSPDKAHAAYVDAKRRLHPGCTI